MSALGDVTKRLLGVRPPKAEPPTIVAPAPEPPPPFLSANLKPDMCEFLLVWTAYNFAVAKSFTQPVVMLPETGWHPAYADMHPFAGMTRAEILISTVPPEKPGGSVDVNPEATKSAAKSADLDTNIKMLLSLAKHEWIRKKCILSTVGVFTKAQERWESRHLPLARAKYYHLKAPNETPEQKIARQRDSRRFIFLPEHPGAIVELCAAPSPAQPLIPAVVRAPIQICKTLAEFQALPEVEQAVLIAAQQPMWEERTVPVGPDGWTSRVRHLDIDLPADPMLDDKTTTSGWNQAPTPEQRASMADDQGWK